LVTDVVRTNYKGSVGIQTENFEEFVKQAPKHTLPYIKKIKWQYPSKAQTRSCTNLQEQISSTHVTVHSCQGQENPGQSNGARDDEMDK
jgi:hypothetical protein